MQSIDIFGRNKSRVGVAGQRGPRGFRGPAGPRGYPGHDSIGNIVRWFPKMATTETRYHEVCCLKINDPARDLLIEASAIKRWNSLSTESNNYAACVNNKFFSTKYVAVNEDVYALKLNGENVYRVSRVELFPLEEKQWAWGCITFRLAAEVEEEQYLFSNASDAKEDAFRGLSVTNTSIKIFGARENDQQPDDYFVDVRLKDSLVNKWCTVYVFWSNAADSNKGYYVVLVQDGSGGGQRMRGEFFCQKLSRAFAQNFVDLFGIYDVSSDTIRHGFRGDVAFFELYIQKNAKETTYPENLSDLVVKSQSVVITM